MASIFFNNFKNSMEQSLIEDLAIESISIYGHEVYYCPRTIVKKDDIYGEDTLSIYNKAYSVDVYIKSFDAYEGDGTFLSKFNLEIRDQVTLCMARRTFANEIGTYESITRPREGDLIFSTMMNRMFVIKYVSNTPVFYQMGALQFWDVVCEVFEYSSERFNTGIAEIDEIETRFTNDLQQQGIVTNDGFMIVDDNNLSIVQGQYDFDNQNGDTYADNDELAEEGNTFIDWTVKDPFGEDTGN